MSYLFFSIAQFINLIASLCRMNVNIVSLFPIIIIWIFMGGSTNDPDFLNYSISYHNSIYISFKDELEIGYLLLEKIGMFMGIEYSHFRMLLIIFPYLLILTTVKKYSANYHYVLLLYMAYALFIDGVQIRNFVAMSFIIFAIRYLIAQGFKNRMLYILFVLIASTIHATSIVYLILLLVNNNKNNISTRIIVLLTILLSALTILNNNEIPFLNYILNSIEFLKDSHYLNTTTTIGFILPMTLHLLNVALMYWANNISKQHVGINKNDNKHEFIKLVFWINVVTIVFFPLYISNLNFYRFIRNFTIINLIAFSTAQTQIKRNVSLKVLFNFAVVINTAAWFFVDYLIMDNFIVVKSLFDFNIFFGE